MLGMMRIRRRQTQWRRPTRERWRPRMLSTCAGHGQECDRRGRCCRGEVGRGERFTGGHWRRSREQRGRRGRGEVQGRRSSECGGGCCAVCHQRLRLRGGGRGGTGRSDGFARGGRG